MYYYNLFTYPFNQVCPIPILSSLVKTYILEGLPIVTRLRQGKMSTIYDF